MNRSTQHTSTQSSSWFPFMWVSRHDNDGKVHQQPSTLLNVNVGATKESTTTESTPPRRSHSSLVSELNDVKQQLMPAARSCADAINSANNSQSTDAA